MECKLQDGVNLRPPRQSLELTKEQLKEEVVKRTQNYFHPDEIQDNLNIEKAMDDFKCTVCQQIPLKLQTCKDCQEVVCVPCQDRIVKEAKVMGTQKRCPNQECENPYEFQFSVFKQKVGIKMLKKMTETHYCQIQFPRDTPGAPVGVNDVYEKEVIGEESKNEAEKEQLDSHQVLDDPQNESTQPQSEAESSEVGRRLNLFELHDHLDIECARNRTCYECKKLFTEAQEFYGHLRYDCEHVKIKCNTCKQELKRKDFKMHECHLKAIKCDFGSDNEEQQDAASSPAQLAATCQLCSKLMAEPCMLPSCAHRFCIQCCKQLQSCPVCQKDVPQYVKCVVDEQMCELIKYSFPEQYQQRQAEIDERQARIITLDFLVGNQHKINEDPTQSTSRPDLTNSHNWTAFVMLQDEDLNTKYIGKLIEKLTFYLHPTFKNPHREVIPDPQEKVQKFELVENGWGVFQLKFTIHWKQETGKGDNPSTFYHMLSFKGNGHWYTIQFEFDKEKIQALMGDDI